MDVPIPFYLSIIAFLTSFILLIFVLKKNPRSEINQIWGLFLVMTMMITLGEAIIRLVGDNEESAIFWFKLLVMPGGGFIAPTFLHFSLIFTKQEKIIRNKFLLAIIYAPIFIVYIRGLLIDVPLDTLEISPFGYYTTTTLVSSVAGPLIYPINMGLIGGLILLGIALLIIRFRITKLEIEKVQIKYMLGGSFLFLGINFIVYVLLPFEISNYFSEATSITAVLMAGIIVFAIVKHKLMAEVKLVSEEISAEPIDYKLEPGYTYIIKECEPTKGFNLFAKAVSKGSHGICITAKNPKAIRDKYGLKRTPIIWITKKDDLKEITVKPSEIVTINDILKPFIDTSKNSVVILVDDHTITKGLVGIKSRQKILGISQSIFDTITHRNSRFIISSKPGSTTTGKPGSITKTRRPLLEFTRLSSFVLEEACNNVVQHLINTGTLTTKDLNKRLNSLTARDTFFLNKANTKITGNIFTGTEGPLNFIKITSGLAKEKVIDKTQSFISAFEDLPHTDKLHSIALKTLTNYGFSEGEYLFHTGDTYIVQEPKVKYSFEIFSDFLVKDYRGLCITISNPEKVMRKYNLNKKMVKMFWLTDIPSPNGDTIFPKLENISAEIERFIREYPDKKIIILDGIEYLITYSGDMYESVLRALRKLAGKISISNASLIIPLNPEIISKERMALLSRSGIEIVKPPK